VTANKHGKKRQIRKSIIGYYLHSALVCPLCTAEAIENGEIIQFLTDQEGNPLSRAVRKFNFPGTHPFTIPDSIFTADLEPVTPVFSTDEYPDGYTCDTCGKIYDNNGGVE
jgi:hypothetical protein